MKLFINQGVIEKCNIEYQSTSSSSTRDTKDLHEICPKDDVFEKLNRNCDLHLIGKEFHSILQGDCWVPKDIQRILSFISV